jgi:hypothetical protein
MSLGNKNVEIVRLLLEHDVDANVRAIYQTPLYLESRVLGIMSLLLKHRRTSPETGPGYGYKWHWKF